MITKEHFTTEYVQLRRKEQRIYTDAEVRMLPFIDTNHLHSAEWEVRTRSCRKLLRYIAAANRPLKILEVGCGNGWLCARLAELAGTRVTGIDINQPELEQARRVFAKIPNLQFRLTTLDEIKEGLETFDMVIFAASIQYFEDLAATIALASQCLREGGEIHVVDTFFYDRSTLEAAKERSAEYFQKMNFPGMASHYFHHSLESLRGLKYRIMYDPHSLLNKMQVWKNPFHWISIRPS